MTDIDNKSTTSTTIPIRPCPFCGSEAQIVTACDPVRYGVQCPACRALFLPIYKSEAEALMRWNRRSGGLSAAGDRGTRGISTAKKRRACRKNLELARRAKMLKKIMAETEVPVTLLKEARRAEIAQIEAAAAESSARLKVHEPQILADPGLRQIYALLKHPQAGNQPGTMADGG